MNVDVPRISMAGLPRMNSTTVVLDVDGASGSLDLEYEWAMVAKEIFELFKEKQKDYGPHNIGLSQDAGIVTRMTDKFMRLHTLYGAMNDPDFSGPQCESINDTWKDVADYAIIALMCRRGDWPKSTLKDVLNKEEVPSESQDSM